MPTPAAWDDESPPSLWPAFPGTVVCAAGVVVSMGVVEVVLAMGAVVFGAAGVGVVTIVVVALAVVVVVDVVVLEEVVVGGTVVDSGVGGGVAVMFAQPIRTGPSPWKTMDLHGVGRAG